MGRSRLRRNEDGFTLVEIMVVVLIIAVLMTIAIPLFANFRARAYDRQAHATLRNLYTVEQGHLVDHGYYAALGNPYLFTWDGASRGDYNPQFESVLDTGSWGDPSLWRSASEG